jgi:FimV-like protein
VDDTVFDETDLESELAASAEYDDLIEDNGNREEITSLTLEAGDARTILLRKTQLENQELRERMTILESQEERRRIQSQNVAVQVNADLKTSKRESGTLVDRLIDILKEQQWYIWLAAALLVLIVIVLLRLPRAQESQTLEAENIESEVAGDDDYTLEPKVNTDAGLLLDGVDGLDLDADDNLFDETDKEIFAEVDDEVSGEIFDSMVEAVAEAEVYLSLGNLEQAVRILEKARAADSNDTACRLKLMEMSFTGGRRDELEALHLEIEQTDDDVAKAIASVIMGSEKEHTAAEEHLISEEPSALGEPAEIIKPIAELAADEDAAEGFGEIDISDLLDGGIEPGDYGKIDALSEAVLGEDFLDDGSAGGGIFAETAIDENASEMGLPNVPELDKGIEFGEVENLYDLDDIEPIEDIDAVDVKLDLANTYIEMGDPEGAREILNEIIGEADEAGQAKARAVLESM